MPAPAHGGSYCSIAGAAGRSSTGRAMVCGPASDGRNRWRSADGPSRAPRRRLLRKARQLGIPVRRGLPDADVQALIDRHAAPALAPTPVVDQVSQAYDTIANGRGEFVSLARLRDSLPDVPRADLDATLLRLNRERAIALEPDPNRLALTDRARAAAISLGGEDMHLIVID